MKHVRRLLTTALVALAVLTGVQLTAAAIGPGPVYLPLVRSAPIRVTGTSYPPAGTFCMLQTSGDFDVDPRTDEMVYSCESKDGHGFIVWTRNAYLILDHVASGSGSLKVIDGAVWAGAIREDGGMETVIVPAVTP